jgi:LDH2 family malate/lactate/ureidoglycolate dehydrogenase
MEPERPWEEETLVLPGAAAAAGGSEPAAPPDPLVPVAATEAIPRLRALGFGEFSARALAVHFLDAERCGRPGHGLSRIAWLETLPNLDPAARPDRTVAEDGFERWEGRGTIGYLVLEAVVRAQLADPPEHARVIAVQDCFPTGMLGHYARRLAEGGLACAITATSPARLASPHGPPGMAGGIPVAGTNPLAIGIPSSDGRPLVSDVSMARVNWGDVLTGAAQPEDVVPFGGDQAHKGFALAVGLQLLVDALAGPPGGYGAVLLVAKPEHDPVPALRHLAPGVRLPGDSRYDGI